MKQNYDIWIREQYYEKMYDVVKFNEQFEILYFQKLILG